MDTWPAYVIHLDSVVERIPVIEAASLALKVPLEIFPASEGSEIWSHDLKHPWRFDKLSKGMVGCGQSHYKLLKMVYESEAPGLLLTEDDLVVSETHESIQELIGNIQKETQESWDILLLGASEYVESSAFSSIEKVGRFWGAHAMYIKRSAIPPLLEVYEDALEDSIVIYGDWMYNEGIRLRNLKVFGPCKTDMKKYVKQTPGLVSSLTGKIRG